MRLILIIVTICLCFPSIAFGIERIVVLDFRTVGITDEGLLSSLSDGVRTGLIKSVDTEQYLIMTRESTMRILKDMGKDASCIEGSCEVEIARNIGADYVISGTITLISETYLLTLKLHNTETNALLASEQIEQKDPLLLVKQMTELGRQLVLDGGLKTKEGLTSNNSTEFQDRFLGQPEDEWEVEGSALQVVHFESTPSGKGTVVLVDGKMVCTETPCSKSVPLGERTISIQRERYQIWSSTTELQKGMRISAELKPVFGWLDLDTGELDGIEFTLNGDSKVSPIHRMELDKGQYTLKITDPCYLGPKGEEYQFEIKAGEAKQISFPVKERPAGIDVSVKDQDGNEIEAMVSVNGIDLGRTPDQFTVGVCSKILDFEYEGMTDVFSLALTEKDIQAVQVVMDLDAYRKREERANREDPFWNMSLGYKNGMYTVVSDATLDLKNGYVYFEDGSQISQGTLPMSSYFDGETGKGFQIQFGLLGELLYGDFQFGFLALPKDKMYSLTDTDGVLHSIVLDFNTVEFGMEGGYIIPLNYVKPIIGVLAGVDVFSGDISSINAASSWASEGVEPYTLVSTESTDDGESLTPKFQGTYSYIGVATGFHIHKSTWRMGLRVKSTLKINTTNKYAIYGTSVLLQIPLK